MSKLTELLSSTPKPLSTRLLGSPLFLLSSMRELVTGTWIMLITHFDMEWRTCLLPTCTLNNFACPRVNHTGLKPPAQRTI